MGAGGRLAAGPRGSGGPWSGTFFEGFLEGFWGVCSLWGLQGLIGFSGLSGSLGVLGFFCRVQANWGSGFRGLRFGVYWCVASSAYPAQTLNPKPQT